MTPEPTLISPDKTSTLLTMEQYQALCDGRFQYSAWVESYSLIPMLTWMKNLISMRALVPTYLLEPSEKSLCAEHFFLQAFQAVCHHFDVNELWPSVREGILAWSGAALRKPLQYVTSPPALCLDLTGGSPESVRIAPDCRDPLLTPGENVRLARDLFKRALRHGHELFERICELTLSDTSGFTSSSVKYLHPAIDYSPQGETVSAYWNLGQTEERHQRWKRALHVLTCLEIPTERLKSWHERFGTVAQTELLGCNFNNNEPCLKVYTMFDGFDHKRLQEVLAMEHCEKAGQPLFHVLKRLEKHGYNAKQNLVIASLYHALDGSAQSGIKIHLNLRDISPFNLSMDELGTIVSESLDKPTSSLRSLPNTLTLESGNKITIIPHTLSFMLSPHRGLCRVTLYVNFIPTENRM